MKKQYRRRREDDSSSDSEGHEDGEVGASSGGRRPPNKLARDSVGTGRAADNRHNLTTSREIRGRDRDKRTEFKDGQRQQGAEERRSSRRYDESWAVSGGNGSNDAYNRRATDTRDLRGDAEREIERRRERERDRAKYDRRTVGERHELRSHRRGVDYSLLQHQRDAAARDRDLNSNSGRGRPTPSSPSTRHRDREIDHDSRRGRIRERLGERSRDRARDGGRQDPVADGAITSGSKTSRGIFSYIAGGKDGGGNGSSPARSPADGGDVNGSAQPRRDSRPARPNSTALSAIIRGDRRSNIRMDREQFDGAQTRLRNLAPEGDEVKDKFSTGCRPDLTGKKDHPFQCDCCSVSFPMATQLSDHLQRAHDIFRHPSLITPTKNLSVGLAADVQNP